MLGIATKVGPAGGRSKKSERRRGCELVGGYRGGNSSRDTGGPKACNGGGTGCVRGENRRNWKQGTVIKKEETEEGKSTRTAFLRTGAEGLGDEDQGKV